jgi:hypothetical protein
MSLRDALPVAIVGVAFRAPVEKRQEDASHRLLQPTTRHVHPSIVRLPSVRLSPSLTETTRHCGSRFDVYLSALAATAPCCLAAARPQVGRRLTAPAKLRFRCSQLAPIFWSRAERCFRTTLPLSRRFRPRAGLAVDTSDAPVPPRAIRDESRGLSEVEDRFR